MSLLEQAVIYLVAALIAVPLSKRLGFGSVLGYLAAGILILFSSSIFATSIGLALMLIGAIYVGTRPSRTP